ncbi:hypothetical protein [Mesorhizobium sp. B2-3-10]|uniref:hypothetical protein n=1 Tax=Mesorhizobium sp. B2-3-10 TaxID=2589954 RepID=UPI001126B46F|nr:hypothetical protein [Mesorhizobium sp. B2-3-10]TPM02015.1 hypothetical protein FJ943_07915 [Mesorhizobium sp. B2-3-10]
MKLQSVNTTDYIRTRLTSVSRVAAFDATPCLDPDIGEAFDFVPNEPGLICWFNADGSLESIDATMDMRKRLIDIYRSTAGNGRRAPHLFAYDVCHDPKAAREKLVEEHVRIYERFPAARTA